MRIIDTSGLTATKQMPLLGNVANESFLTGDNSKILGIDFLQEAYSEITTKLAQAICPSGNATILEGFSPTGSSMPAGGVYYNGEIFIYNGGTISGSVTSYIACFINDDPNDNGTRAPYTTLSDNSQVSIHKRRSLSFSYASGPNTGDLPDYGSWVQNQVNLNETQIASNVSAISALQGGSWQPLSGLYVNSWANTGGSYYNGRYKLENGYVVLSGNMQGGVSGTICFTLPAGYRPTQRVDLNLSTNSSYAAYITILSTGVVTVYFTSGATTFSFEGLRFPLT